MKKRLIALLLVVTMLCSTAFAVTPFREIKYESPSLTELKSLADHMEKSVENNSPLELLVSVYNDMQIEYERLYTMYSIATLHQYQQGDNQKQAEEVSKCYRVLTDAFELMRATTVTMLSSQYEADFRKAWGDDVVDSYLNSEAMTEEKRTLNEKIANKLAEYSTLSLTPAIERDGKTVTFDDVETAGEKLVILALWQQRLGEIYIELVKLRKELTDGDAMDEFYRGFYRDYTPEDARGLESSVAEILADTQKKVYQVYDSDAAYNLSFDLPEEELIKAASAALGNIHPSLAQSYQIMIQNGLYDVEYRKEKRDGAFCVTFPSYQSPFLYIQPGYDVETVHSFYHEFGHYNEMLHSDMHRYFPGGIDDVDAAEVMSNALALMSSGQMDDIFGAENGEIMAEFNVYRVLFALVSACLVDEFEQYAFSTEDLTYEKLNNKFSELTKKYHINTWSESTWTQISHIYETPGYYISYAVSSISAMELWERYEEDPAAGVESYLEAVDHCEEGYQELVDNAGLHNPFATPEMVKRVRTAVERTFGILVDTYGHWAETEIDMFVLAGVVSGYRGSDGMQYFKPDQNVTRAEFVKLLRGIHTDQALPQVSESAFSDVKPTDWHAPYIAWAVENGLVNGVNANTFAPNSTITRQDMAVILHRYLLKAEETLVGIPSQFHDAASIADYAKEAVSLLSGVGILNGLPNGNFQPSGTVTRAAAAKALVSVNHYVAYGPQQTTQPTTATSGVQSRAPISARIAAMFAL